MSVKWKTRGDGAGICLLGALMMSLSLNTRILAIVRYEQRVQSRVPNWAWRFGGAADGYEWLLVRCAGGDGRTSVLIRIVSESVCARVIDYPRLALLHHH